MPIDYSNALFACPKSRPRVLERQDKLSADLTAQKRVARLVRLRDGGCRVAGCKRGPLETHHLVKRSASKLLRHDVANLVTLCRLHHQLAESNVLRFTGSPETNAFAVTDTRTGVTTPARAIRWACGD